MSKDSGLVLSDSDDSNIKDANIDYSVSSESQCSMDKVEFDVFPDLKTLNSYEIRILIKRNRIDFREKLKEYFL